MRVITAFLIAFFWSGQLCSCIPGPPPPPTTLHVKRWQEKSVLKDVIKELQRNSLSGQTKKNRIVRVRVLQESSRAVKILFYVKVGKQLNATDAIETSTSFPVLRSSSIVNAAGNSSAKKSGRNRKWTGDAQSIRRRIHHECRANSTRVGNRSRENKGGRVLDESFGGKYECQLIRVMLFNGCGVHVKGCFKTGRNGTKNGHSVQRRQKRSSDSRPELVYTFIEQAVQPGAQVALKCSAVGEPPPRFRWTLDGQTIPSHHGASVSEGRESGPPGAGTAGYVLSSLTISTARVEHGGRYECRATNVHGSVAHAARLNVYGSPYIRSMNTIKAVAGAEVVVWCPYYGFPIDSVKWEGGAGSDPRYQHLEGQLRIVSVDKTRDQGSWTCSVQTPGGELARREVQMVVVSPPVLSKMSFPDELKVGERTQITCTVTSGDMPVYFSWLKDQMPIASALQVEERNAEFLSMLLFKSLTATHSGIYTCVVSNTAGKANTSAELAIKVPPYWHVEPSDAAVLLNASVTINCDARGHPTPTIYWTKFSGSTETSLGGVSEPIVLGNGSLRIESARAEHSGKYRCRADNGVSPPLARTLTLHVNEPARFESGTVNVTGKLGESVRLACVARGDSPLSTVWSHGGVALPNSNYRMSISETRSSDGLRSELVVERTDRRDSGVYRCQASNPYGRSDHFIHLTILEPPEPPANFRIIETSSRSVRVAWRKTYDGNSPVLGLVIQYRRHDSTAPELWRDAHSHNVSLATSHNYSDSAEAVISGLEPATAYLIRARTVTAHYASAHSRAVLALTQHEPPARAPSALRTLASVVGGGNSAAASAAVHWQPPPRSSWNGELLGYTVWWWPSAEGSMAGGSTAGMQSATVRGLANKYIIEGLDHYTRYSICVRAYNSAGSGPASAPITVLTPEYVPVSGPIGVRCRSVSPRSVKVEWSPPPAHTHKGALLGYKLLYRAETASNWVEWDIRGSGNLPTQTGAEIKRVAGVETLLLALRPFTNYTIQALAYTAVGDGVPAPAIRCITQQDVPSPPAAVKVVSTSATSLAVSWLPPSRPNGPILYYTVFYRELGRDRPPQTTTVQTEEDPGLIGLGGVTELRSLHEGSTHEAWVTAHSAAGEGEPSSPQPATTSATGGGRVVSFGVHAVCTCGAGLRASCVSRGSPAPRARWLRHERPVTHDPAAKLTPGGDLLIHEVDTSTTGNYTCSARNTFGSEEITYKVDCIARPLPPQVTLESVDHTEARLSWRTVQRPQAMPYGFTIWWVRVREEISDSDPVRGEEEKRLEVGGEVFSTILRALSCGATYSVRAVAYSRAGASASSAPLLVRTKPPVLSWEGADSTSEGTLEESSPTWSNSSCIVLDLRRAVRCEARVRRVQWRGARGGGGGGPAAWRDAPLCALHDHHVCTEVIIDNLAAGVWYAIRLWTTTEYSRHQAIIYAATTTHTGERLRRPMSFVSEGSGSVVTSYGADADRVLGAVSLAFAALAAVAVTALIFVLVARKSTLWPCGTQPEDDVRRCSHSAASTDKSVCPETQNLRNCQHDYKHDKLSPESDVYEISPYATFAVGQEATLDHSLQFRTFGHRENDALPHRPRPRPCRKHPSRHQEASQHEKHLSDCELSQLSRYEKVRPRNCAPSSSYCVPMQHHGTGGGGSGSGGGGGSGGGFSEVYAGDSSAESGPGSLSPKTHLDHS